MDKATEVSDENLLLRTRGYDLFAVVARYHSTCRTKYMSKDERWKRDDKNKCIKKDKI